jgi:acetate kinase
MGFSPLEGLMMGTRSGSLDPGLLLYLQAKGIYTTEELDHLLNQESGLKGMSGLSGDMREILSAINQGNKQAKLTLDLFVYRLATAIGAFMIACGGLDILAFTGGIGEHVPEVRQAVCQYLAWLGVRLDEASNNRADRDMRISTSSSPIEVVMIKSQEEWAIARACEQLLHQ